MNPILSYPGSKWGIANQIVAQFPPHLCYVEVFGGSGAVLFTKPPSEVEVFNDLNHDVVTLFRVVRDEWKCQRLIRLLKLTPFSRLEFSAAYRRLQIQDWRDDVDHAWLTYVVYNQSFSGTGHGWGNSQKQNSKNRSFYDRLPGLIEISKRLKTVQIECSDWRKCIRQYSSSETLFYLDPPYWAEARNTDRVYKHDMNAESLHRELVEAIQSLPGMFILSGYSNPVYDQLGWRTIEIPVLMSMHNPNVQGNTSRTEKLWFSSNIPEPQPSLLKQEVHDESNTSLPQDDQQDHSHGGQGLD